MSQLMSPKDLSHLRAVESEIPLWIRTFEVAAAERLRSESSVLKVQAIRSNYRLLERPFDLTVRTAARQAFGFSRAYLAWGEPWCWNRRNPLDSRVNCRGSRHQISARMVRKVETMDDSAVPNRMRVVVGQTLFGPIVETKISGWKRNERDHPIFQGTRTSNFAIGAKYAGGGRAARVVKDTVVEEPKVDRAEVERLRKITDLERRVRELMGLLKL